MGDWCGMNTAVGLMLVEEDVQVAREAWCKYGLPGGGGLLPGSEGYMGVP